jgi:hypothetical protein
MSSWVVTELMMWHDRFEGFCFVLPWDVRWGEIKWGDIMWNEVFDRSISTTCCGLVQSLCPGSSREAIQHYWFLFSKHLWLILPTQSNPTHLSRNTIRMAFLEAWWCHKIGKIQSQPIFGSDQPVHETISHVRKWEGWVIGVIQSRWSKKTEVYVHGKTGHRSNVKRKWVGLVRCLEWDWLSRQTEVKMNVPTVVICATTFLLSLLRTDQVTRNSFDLFLNLAVERQVKKKTVSRGINSWLRFLGRNHNRRRGKVDYHWEQENGSNLHGSAQQQSIQMIHKLLCFWDHCALSEWISDRLIQSREITNSQSGLTDTLKKSTSCLKVSGGCEPSIDRWGERDRSVLPVLQSSSQKVESFRARSILTDSLTGPVDT